MSKHPQKMPTHYGKKGKTAQQHSATKATNSQTSEQVIHQIYDLTLTFQAPLLSQSAETLGLGIDSMMQRYQGQYALNGSLVKGNIRHALEQLDLLLDATLNTAITRWLGHKPKEGVAPEDDAAQWDGEARGKVYFDTFWLYQPDSKTPKTDQTKKLRNRIKVTDKGTVEDGALMSVEDCFVLDSKPSFTGQLRASFLDAREQEQFEYALDKALQLIPAMGSLKGIGFGRLTESNLDPSLTASTTSALKLKSRTYLRLRFKQPFCVGSTTSPSDNRIQSENFISGAILKGALAQQYARTVAKPNIDLSRRINDKYQFDKLLFSHALPVTKGSTKRPLPIPLSLVSDGEGLFDASGYTLEQLIEALGDKTASFQPDWKDKEWQAAIRLCKPSHSPQHLTLVRTAIDAERNTAKESQLFSMECVDPQDTEWLCHINISQVTESRRPSVLKDLAQLLGQGIAGIGKTKAYAHLETIESPISYSSPLPDKFTTPIIVKVMLVTQARLLPRQLERLLKNSPSDLQSDQVLEPLYQNYWQQHSERGLSLVRYFARQKRYGGEYAKRHYQQQTNYAPEWMTEAGSVFVLQIENEKGLNYLKQWQQVGLPAAPETDGSPATWQTTAFIPENGYGEIVINEDMLARHTSPATAYPIQEVKP